MITSSHVEFLAGHQAHQEHAHNEDMHRRRAGDSSPYAGDEKATIEAVDHA